MLIFTNKNLFETDANLLVNTVNTVGVMGKGIALEFKKDFQIILNFIKNYVIIMNLK